MLWIKITLQVLSCKSYDFGIVRMKYPKASGGLLGGTAPQTPCNSDASGPYSDSFFQEPLPAER